MTAPARGTNSGGQPKDMHLPTRARRSESQRFGGGAGSGVFAMDELEAFREEAGGGGADDSEVKGDEGRN